MAWRRAPSPLQQPAAPTGVAAGSPLGAEARRASLTWDRGAPSGAWRRAERGRSSARLSGAVALAAKPSKRGAFVISKYVFLSTLTNSNSRSQITSCRISRTEFSCQVLKFPPGRLSSHRRSPVMPLPPTSALDPMHCSMLAQKSHCAGSPVNGSHSPHRTPPTPGEAVTSLMPQLSLPTATAAGGGGSTLRVFQLLHRQGLTLWLLGGWRCVRWLVHPGGPALPSWGSLGSSSHSP